MTVRADESAVEPDIARGIGRHGGKLGGKEILLAHAVLFAKILQYGKLDFIAHLAVRVRQTAHYDVELFALDDLARLRRHLIGAEMREQIVNIEHGIVGFFAD